MRTVILLTVLIICSSASPAQDAHHRFQVVDESLMEALRPYEISGGFSLGLLQSDDVLLPISLGLYAQYEYFLFGRNENLDLLFGADPEILFALPIGARLPFFAGARFGDFTKSGSLEKDKGISFKAGYEYLGLFFIQYQQWGAFLRGEVLIGNITIGYQYSDAGVFRHRITGGMRMRL